LSSIPGPRSDRPLHLSELSRDAQKQLYAANQLICRSYSTIEFNGGRGVKWHLFLDNPIEIVESCALASGITILRITGERADSHLLQQAISTLCRLQQASGGWTSWVSTMEQVEDKSAEEPLTLDTFYALRALFVSEQNESKSFSDGINWLLSTACLEGGWGFYRGGKPFVLPTSYAVRILSQANSARPSPSMKDAIDRGLGWLLAAQSPDGGWGRAPKEESSSVHTALGLMALAEAGFNGLSPHVISGRRWLLANHLGRFVIFDTYDVPSRNTKRKTSVLRTINHLNFAEGLILQGLLAAETDLLDIHFQEAATNLLRLHETDGHWKCLHAGFKQPIYAIMDACIALSRLVREVDSRRLFLEISEHIQTFQIRFDSVAEQLQQLDNKIEAINSENSRNFDELASINAFFNRINMKLLDLERGATRIDRIEEGLWLLSPVTIASRFSAQYRLFSSVLFLLLICGTATLIAWYFYGIKSRLFLIVSFATNGVLLLINIISFYFQLYPRLAMASHRQAKKGTIDADV
jgi:hypothetical protein